MNSDDGLCGDDEKWSDEEAHDAEMSERELGSDAEMEEEGTTSSSPPSPLKKSWRRDSPPTETARRSC